MTLYHFLTQKTKHMPNKDQLHRFIIENTHVRGEMVHLDATWQAILERSDYPENIRKVFGEALAACALLSATIKFDGELILQIRGNGPLHLLVVQASSSGNLRGIARWKNHVPNENLQAIFGKAQMVMTIEPNKGEPYQGIIALQGETIKDAIEAYFQQSEQLATRLWLASDDKSCTGFLLQELPSDKTEADDDNWNRTTHLAATLTQNELLELPVNDILHRLFHQDDVRLFDSTPLCFRCHCSRERIANMLIGLGQNEVENIIDEQKIIEVDCEFCNAHYRFDSVDAKALFNHSNEGNETQH